MADTLSKALLGPNFSGDMTVDIGIDGTANPKVKIGLESNLQITATADPDDTPSFVVTKIWSDTFNLSSGTKTLDLTALARAALAAVDLTGLIVRGFVIYNRPTNSAAIVCTVGGTNPYQIFGGTADGKVTLEVGHWAAIGAASALGSKPLVSSTVKNILITSGDVDATVEVGIMAG